MTMTTAARQPDKPVTDPRRLALMAAIHEARRERMSQIELARSLGVPQSYISRWENRRPPRREKLAEIEVALDLPMGTLLRRAGYVDAGSTDPEDAIRGDTRLTPEYQEMVLAFYRTALENSATARDKRDARKAPRSSNVRTAKAAAKRR